VVRESVYSPAHQRAPEDDLRFRIGRVPSVLDKVFRTRQPSLQWEHFDYFRLLVMAMAFAWGRRTVTNLSRDLGASPHRTRCNNFFLVQRWVPEAALRQKAGERLRALPRNREKPAIGSLMMPRRPSGASEWMPSPR
jgi:hypothetical protein